MIWWGDAHLRGTVALTDDLHFPTFLLRQPRRSLAGFKTMLARRLRPRRAFPQPVVASLPIPCISAVRQARARAATPAPLLAPAVFGR